MIQRDILEADRVRETEEGIHKVKSFTFVHHLSTDTFHPRLQARPHQPLFLMSSAAVPLPAVSQNVKFGFQLPS
jgi:hypothetical protein